MLRAVAEAAAAWWAARLERPELRGAFFEALKLLVEAELELDRAISCYARELHGLLDCDYDPRGVLLAALHAVGIECSGYCWSAEGLLPMKTVMRIRGREVTVKNGYGARYEEVPVEQLEFELGGEG